MSLMLGVKRSYRYFLPAFVFEPRRLVRQLFVPAFFYFLGWSAAGYTYGGPAQHDHISKVSLVVLLALLILKWWTGRFQPGDWYFENSDGRWQRYRG